MNSVLRSTYKTISLSLPFGFLKLLKISKIMGLRFSAFSASAIVAPVLASQISLRELLGVTGLRTLVHAFITGGLSFLKLFYHAPSFIGAVYFKTFLKPATLQDRFIGAAAPLLCMAIFASTTVGGQASVYSLYWFIPAIIALLPRRTVFLTALGSTFMTHAVGSVIFILLTPMTPAFWIALLPVVLFERLLFASGITTTYYAFNHAHYLMKALAARLAHA